MKRLIISCLILLLLLGCSKSEETIEEVAAPITLSSNNFFVLICPNGHQTYFTDWTQITGDIINTGQWHTNNKGNFYKGYYQPMRWDNPTANSQALCPICDIPLKFENKYLKRLEVQNSSR